MYPLIRWKWLTYALVAVVGAAVYADDVARLFDIAITDQSLIRYLPPALLTPLVAGFGFTGYLAPWRVVWRLVPAFNRWFPDLNGVWIGSTDSNWPTLKRMLDKAQEDGAIDAAELHAIPEQRDAIAIQITASLFRLKITSAQSATNGRSCSITAKPRRDQHTGHIHIVYVYEQETPIPEVTDEERHMGAVNLVIDPDNLEKAEGHYWTRRNWKSGLNTAGMLNLRRVAPAKDKGKSLRQYAAEEKKRLQDSGEIVA